MCLKYEYVLFSANSIVLWVICRYQKENNTDKKVLHHKNQNNSLNTLKLWLYTVVLRPHNNKLKGANISYG